MKVVVQVLSTLERILTLALASSGDTRERAVLMRVHVTLKLVLALEELVGEADATLQDLGCLSAGVKAMV